eukprot:13099440-Alexandrium_andersonii.AAC.1
MSASLVGSEMCIRDRRGQHAWRLFGVGAVALGMCDLAYCSRCGRHRAVTVSYTHLTLPTICSV